MSLLSRSTKEQEENAALAKSYKDISGFMAWKHLIGVLDDLKEKANQREDSIHLSELTPVHVGWARGARDTIDTIKRSISFAMEGELK